MSQDTQFTAMSNAVRVVVYVVLTTLACVVYTTLACVCCCVCCVCVVVQARLCRAGAQRELGVYVLNGSLTAGINRFLSKSPPREKCATRLFYAYTMTWKVWLR